MFAAIRHGLPVPPDALAGTLEWLTEPGRWESNHGDPQFSDKKLSRIQFAASVAEAARARLAGPVALSTAARLVAADQLPDGSWQGDTGTPAGSPVTYNAAMATYSALRVLQQAGGFEQAVARAAGWLKQRAPKSTPEAAAIAMAVNRQDSVDYLIALQNRDGGWGPFPRSPSEVYDTALAILALRERAPPAVARGRAYLLGAQLEAGGWPETTRPSGGQSYAQHISTTAWALAALLETK
ncbi:MAG: prenyltransferase/squalene oxidase repeat-containing protein [Bryobacteraceae bacterium]|nr:prenyltransferase/squalene oxidase repeat-containing protein [Bryobacteraceae bacterium]